MLDFENIFSVLAVAFAIIWILTALGNQKSRSSLNSNISSLITTPNIFEKTSEEMEKKFYPRFDPVKSANRWWLSVVKPIKDGINNLTVQISESVKSISSTGNDIFKSFDYIILLLMFAGFIIADAILITNTLEYFGLVEGNIIEIFRRYELAITFGSLISVVIGGLLANDLFGNGTFSDWGARKDTKWGIAGKFLAVLLILSGLFVIGSFGISRFSEAIGLTGDIKKNMGNLGEFAIHLLAPLNASIAALLIADDGFVKGTKTIILSIALLGLGILIVFDYIIGFIVSTVLFLVDVIWRFFLIILSITGFILLTPLDQIFNRLNSMGKRTDDAQQSQQ